MTFGPGGVELCCRRSGRDCSWQSRFQVTAVIAHTSLTTSAFISPSNICCFPVCPGATVISLRLFLFLSGLREEEGGKKKIKQNRRNCSAPVLIHATKFPEN